MKFRTGVFLFIILVLLAAWITKPSAEDFKKFRESSNTIASPPLIEAKDGFFYSSYTVSYFNVRKLSTKTNDNTDAAIAVPVSKEKYLGLFGKFWKID
jgi:hypothetical protein